MKVLVLGASGFLGSNFLKLINLNKYKLLCLSRSIPRIKKLNFLRCDFNNTIQFNEIAKRFKPDICIDFSWHGIPDYSKKNNLLNLSIKKKIFKILVNKHCKKIISIGSCWEYGDEKGKVKENKKNIKNQHDFAKTKIKILNLLKKYNEQNKLKFIWGRLFYVYGPFGKRNSLLQSLISDYEKGNKLKLKNTKESHDFIHVNDACRIIKDLSFNNVKSGVYNIGSGRCHSNLEFLKTFHDIVKKNKHYVKSYICSNCLSSDNSKINKSINLKNKFSLYKGIKNTLKAQSII